MNKPLNLLLSALLLTTVTLQTHTIEPELKNSEEITLSQRPKKVAPRKNVSLPILAWNLAKGYVGLVFLFAPFAIAFLEQSNDLLFFLNKQHNKQQMSSPWQGDKFDFDLLNQSNVNLNSTKYLLSIISAPFLLYGSYRLLQSAINGIYDEAIGRYFEIEEDQPEPFS